MVSRLLIALIVIRNSAFFVTGMYEICGHEDRPVTDFFGIPAEG